MRIKVVSEKVPPNILSWNDLIVDTIYKPIDAGEDCFIIKLPNGTALCIADSTFHPAIDIWKTKKFILFSGTVNITLSN